MSFQKIFFRVTGLLFFVLAFFFSACGNRPNFMNHEMVFYAKLGSGTNEIGSNKEELEKSVSKSQEYLVREYLDFPSSIQIFQNKLYIADKYNKRVSIFDLAMPASLKAVISNTGPDYSFGIPFQVVLNKYGEIYVVASDPTISNRNDPYQYYIYKFSQDGRFSFKLGKSGLNSGPMAYPDRIETDLYDNLYVYYRNITNSIVSWDVLRFSRSGEMNFEFDTRYLSLTNVRDNRTFAGHISGIWNLNNNEELLVHNNFESVKKDGKILDTPDEYYSTVSVYSVLQNSIIRDLFDSKNDMDGIVRVTWNDDLVMMGYRPKSKGIRFRFIDFQGTRPIDHDFYAPVLPNQYLNGGFYVDNRGEIYSIIIKDLQYFVLLHWKKRLGARDHT